MGLLFGAASWVGSIRKEAGIMADIYVLATDLPLHKDPELAAYKFKAGDVIAVREDGDGIGKAAEKSGIYKVIRVDGTREKWAFLEDSRPFVPGARLPKRINRMDVLAVYEAEKTNKAAHPTMGECIVLGSAAVRAISFKTADIAAVVD